MCPHNLANADRGGPEVIYLPIPEVEVAGMDLAGATQKPVDTSFRPFGAAEHIQRCHSRMRNDARVVESRTHVDPSSVQQKISMERLPDGTRIYGIADAWPR
jgi:hypothetical protein